MFAAIDYDLFTITAIATGLNPQVHLPDIRLHSITNSSLEVRPGSLFVPLKDRRDGHDFIADAVERGALAFFARKNHPVLKKLPADVRARAIIVDDPLLSLGRLAKFHRDRYTPLVIAVTGSNGKTTTKEMLAQIFGAALGKACVATVKNYNNHIGVPFTLFSIGPETRAAIIEMGMNHAGEIAYLTRLASPHAALISSIGHAHIEFFRSRAGIAQAKAEIVQGMPQGGRLYLPANIAELKTIRRAAAQARVLVHTVDMNKSILRVKKRSAEGFVLSIGKRRLMFPYANAAWVSNLALAVEAACDAGITADSIASAVEKFKPADGRMQFLNVPGSELTVIDDGYNANPDSAIASIDSALQAAAGRPVVCVFGDFKELGRFSNSLHTWTGTEAARAGVAAFYGIGRDMRHAVTAFRRKAPMRPAENFTREKFSQLAAKLRAEAGNAIILVKGSRSMRMEEFVALLRK